MTAIACPACGVELDRPLLDRPDGAAPSTLLETECVACDAVVHVRWDIDHEPRVDLVDFKWKTALDDRTPVHQEDQCGGSGSPGAAGAAAKRSA